MRNAGIPTPSWVAATSPDAAASAVAEAGLRYPLFVKPNSGGSSVGVSRVETGERLRDAVAKALENDRQALIEEMVRGRELTAGWLDGRLLPLIEMNAQAEFYDYQAKYLSDATRYACPAEVDADMAAIIGRHVLGAVDAVGARDLARVDVMLGPDGPMFLELNALPGFTSHSLLPMAAAADGMPLESLCVKLADMAASRAGLSFSEKRTRDR
jgi:D-alanine-D-alanine ligase